VIQSATRIDTNKRQVYRNRTERIRLTGMEYQLAGAARQPATGEPFSRGEDPQRGLGYTPRSVIVDTRVVDVHNLQACAPN